MNEKYKLNKEWLDLLIEHKNNENVTFNLSNNDIRILLTYIEALQQENARLKEKIEKSIMYIENTYDDVVSSFTEDKPMTNFKARKELLEILKEN